jgi:predicted kinase
VPTPQIIMPLGLSASGKSTWSRDQVLKAPPGTVIRISNDDLNRALHAGRRGGEKTKNHVEHLRDLLVIDAVRQGLTVIVDNTNIHPKHEARLRQIAAIHGAVFRIQDFTKVPVEECIARDAQRPPQERVGKQIIIEQSKALAHRKPHPGMLHPQPYFAPPGAPACYIFDIDGTLALMGDEPGARRPYDYERVLEDRPNEAVVELAQTLLLAGETILLLTGRSELCRADTTLWAAETVAPDLPLFMRADGDDRPDYQVKFDLFQAHIAGRYRVKAWVDDRQQVVDMARHILGLPVWQVAPGNF